jgi:hypothetical protein
LTPFRNDDPGFFVVEKPNWDGNENVEPGTSERSSAGQKM